MPDPSFDNVEDNGGEILRDESQNRLVAEMVGSLDDAAVRGGVCKAMCAKWIATSVHNDDFWETLHSPDVRETLRVMQHQEAAAGKMMAAALGTAGKDGSYDRGKTNAALLEAKFKEMLQQPVSANIATAQKASDELRDTWASNYIKKNTQLDVPPLTSVKPDELVQKLGEGAGYYLFGIEGARGGHAMALYNMPGVGVQYFDPNFGEAIFTDTAKFKNWLQKHLSDYGDALGTLTASKLTFVEMKSAPDRTDCQKWVVEHAGDQRGTPPPVHWPAWESAKATQAEKQRIEDQRVTAHLAHLQAQFGQGGTPTGGGGGRKANRGAMVLAMGAGVGVGPVPPAPTPTPTAPPTTGGGTGTPPSKADKKSWRNATMYK